MTLGALSVHPWLGRVGLAELGQGKVARGCWSSPGSPGVTGCHLLSGQSCGQWSLQGPDGGPPRLTSPLGPWCVVTVVSLSRGPDTPKNPWRRTGWRDCGKPQAGCHVGRAGTLGLSCPHSLPGPAGLREDLARTPPWGLELQFSSELAGGSAGLVQWSSGPHRAARPHWAPSGTSQSLNLSLCH